MKKLKKIPGLPYISLANEKDSFTDDKTSSNINQIDEDNVHEESIYNYLDNCCNSQCFSTRKSLNTEKTYSLFFLKKSLLSHKHTWETKALPLSRHSLLWGNIKHLLHSQCIFNVLKNIISL